MDPMLEDTVELLDSVINTNDRLEPLLVDLTERAAAMHPRIHDPELRQFFRDMISICEQVRVANENNSGLCDIARNNLFVV